MEVDWIWIGLDHERTESILTLIIKLAGLVRPNPWYPLSFWLTWANPSQNTGACFHFTLPHDWYLCYILDMFAVMSKVTSGLGAALQGQSRGDTWAANKAQHSFSSISRLSTQDLVLPVNSLRQRLFSLKWQIFYHEVCLINRKVFSDLFEPLNKCTDNPEHLLEKTKWFFWIDYSY